MGMPLPMKTTVGQHHLQARPARLARPTTARRPTRGRGLILIHWLLQLIEEVTR